MSDPIFAMRMSAALASFVLSAWLAVFSPDHPSAVCLIAGTIYAVMAVWRWATA